MDVSKIALTTWQPASSKVSLKDDAHEGQQERAHLLYKG